MKCNTGDRGCGHAGEGVFQLMIVSIRKSYPGHARNHARYLVAGQACLPGRVVVDHDVNVQNFSEVVWKTCVQLIRNGM